MKRGVRTFAIFTPYWMIKDGQINLFFFSVPFLKARKKCSSFNIILKRGINILSHLHNRIQLLKRVIRAFAILIFFLKFRNFVLLFKIPFCKFSKVHLCIHFFLITSFVQTQGSFTILKAFLDVHSQNNWMASTLFQIVCKIQACKKCSFR